MSVTENEQKSIQINQNNAECMQSVDPKQKKEVFLRSSAMATVPEDLTSSRRSSERGQFDVKSSIEIDGESTG